MLNLNTTNAKMVALAKKTTLGIPRHVPVPQSSLVRSVKQWSTILSATTCRAATEEFAILTSTELAMSVPVPEVSLILTNKF